VKKIVLCVTFFGLFYQMFLSTTNIRLIFKSLENRSSKNYGHPEKNQEIHKSHHYNENENIDESDGMPNLFFDNLPELEVASELINSSVSLPMFIMLSWIYLRFDAPSQIEVLNLEYTFRKPPRLFFS